jgi:hypothetical protein
MYYNGGIFNRKLVKVNLDNLARYEKALENLKDLKTLDSEKLYSRQELKYLLNMKTEDFIQKSFYEPNWYRNIDFVPSKVEEKTITIYELGLKKDIQVKKYYYNITNLNNILISQIEFSKRALKDMCVRYPKEWDTMIEDCQVKKNMYAETMELIKTWN